MVKQNERTITHRSNYRNDSRIFHYPDFNKLLSFCSPRELISRLEKITRWINDALFAFNEPSKRLIQTWEKKFLWKLFRFSRGTLQGEGGFVLAAMKMNGPLVVNHPGDGSAAAFCNLKNCPLSAILKLTSHTFVVKQKTVDPDTRFYGGEGEG